MRYRKDGGGNESYREAADEAAIKADEAHTTTLYLSRKSHHDAKRTQFEYKKLERAATEASTNLTAARKDAFVISLLLALRCTELLVPGEPVGDTETQSSPEGDPQSDFLGSIFKLITETNSRRTIRSQVDDKSK